MVHSPMGMHSQIGTMWSTVRGTASDRQTAVGNARFSTVEFSALLRKSSTIARANIFDPESARLATSTVTQQASRAVDLQAVSAVQERVALIASSFTGDNAGDFGKPTPVPPTSTPEPSPTPVVLGDPIFGPVNGSLQLESTANQIPEFESGVNIDAGVADAIFENPNVSGKWSHGFVFRNSAEETFHAVFINSDGEWGHFARGGSLGNQPTLALGQFDFDRTVGGEEQVDRLVRRSRWRRKRRIPDQPPRGSGSRSFVRWSIGAGQRFSAIWTVSC